MLRSLNKTTVSIQKRSILPLAEWTEVEEQSTLFGTYLQTGILRIVKEIEKIKATKIAILQLYFAFADSTPFLMGCDKLTYDIPKVKERISRKIGNDLPPRILRCSLLNKSMATKSAQLYNSDTKKENPIKRLRHQQIKNHFLRLPKISHLLQNMMHIPYNE